MKKIIFLLFTCVTTLTFSQIKSFQIDWKGIKTMSLETSNFKVPHFNSDNFNFSIEKGLIFFSQWKSDNYIDEQSVLLDEINYRTITRSELGDINPKNIPIQPKYTLKNSISRDKHMVYFELSPIIQEKGVFKKVTSFKIKYNSARGNQFTRNSQEIINSALGQGEWYKFYIDTTGVFKLSRSFLASLGVNVNSVNPKAIKVYGQGGKSLPLSNNEYYPFDLVENAIVVKGEDDGEFNANDYVLFYGEGPKGYNPENNSNINPYTDKAHYYIRIGNGLGKRIQFMVEPNAVADLEIDTFQEYQFHEVDEFNLAKLGRRWFGDRFDFDSDKVFNFDFENLITSEPINVKVFAAAVGAVPTSMQLKVNSTDVDNFYFAAINDPILATQDSYVGNLTVNSSQISVNLNYENNGNPSSTGYLDYIGIEATRSLTHTGNQFIFKNNAVALESGIAQYSISNASNVSEIWDITDKYNVTRKLNSDDDSVLSFKALLGEIRYYLAVDPSDYFEPKKNVNTSVTNQNIKGTVFKDNAGNFQDIDYIIVTRNDMLSQAERLAQINRDQYDLNVKVYDLEAIYTEFSSGNQDISAIRNFMKYVYNNASSPDNRIKYLCLFGDASFDYKNRISNNTNVVPAWNSLNSFSLSASFVSDDFFGMMDENEGTMSASDKLDIAVGRILADTPQRAKEMVDKIQSYYDEEAYGSWRNNFITISDDVDESWETIIQGTTDNIGQIVTQDKPNVNVIKIHSDAFVQESTAGGERYPDVNKAIFDAIEVGALVVNYFGHGGEDGIARERIFDKINAQELKNPCKLNCFVTVTCEYTKFDNPLRPAAGEYLYWNKEGGAIGLITTTRQIFVSVGVAFNVVLEKYLFAFGSNDYPSMAEALRLTKNDQIIGGIEQRRLVFFIGDPAMKLAFPKPNIRLTEINDMPISGQIEPLNALSRAKIKGEIVDELGVILSDYSGTLTATIFDKDIQRSTLGNDGTTQNGELIILDFNTLGETIFRGQATISNGIFEFDFVVPRDITLEEGNGKISFYAKTLGVLEDRGGANFDIRIGGVNENAPEDNEGPEIMLFMNDENFISGGITNESPTLLAKLKDENGINTASGIGHDIVAIIDGDEANPFKLNDYYQSDIDDYQSGSLSYPFRDLEPGLHTLSFKAWDVYNNSASSELQFVVYDQNESLVIENVLNYPNPFVNYTEFWFNHNSSEVLDVSVQIFTVSGKLVKTINGQTQGGIKNTTSVSRDIIWDGKDDFGDKIAKGVYVYKLTVRSSLLNKQVEKYQKLVIL
jgi:hypothetical protein